MPPGEDPETCQSWLRMRYRDGRYTLMFEEWVVEVSAAAGGGHFWRRLSASPGVKWPVQPASVTHSLHMPLPPPPSTYRHCTTGRVHHLAAGNI